MSEKFSLKWKNYQSNWNKSLSGLRNDTESADVTLISDDKIKFAAHKILLLSCSDTFRFILKGYTNTHANQLLYLGGVSSINLAFILDYIYYGEVNLFQEQLDSFLESAQKLEIEGLMRNKQDSGHVNINYSKKVNVQEQTQKQGYHQEFDEESGLKGMDENPVQGDTRRYAEDTLHEFDEESGLTRMHEKPVQGDTRRYTKDTLQEFDEESGLTRMEENPVQGDTRRYAEDTLQSDVRLMTADEIETTCMELYQKVEGTWRCMACTFSTKWVTSMKRHVEIHLLGLSYTCPTCNKEFKSKNSLAVHKSVSHKSIK